MTATVPAPLFVGRYPVGSNEWHDARRSTVNGSEIAAVMGISPYESPFSLWHRKSGGLGEVEQNDVMLWGNLLEDVIIGEFRRRHPELYVADGGGLWRHPERPWQGGSPDGRVWRDRDHPWPEDERQPDELVEIKTARFDDGWGDPGTDVIPVHYRAQVLWYLDVFGLSRCHVAVLIGGSDYREYLVEFDEDEVAPMRAAADQFLATIQAGQQPPIDGHDATYEAVKELHPDISPETVELRPAIAEAYLQALADHKDAEAEKRRMAGEVITAMAGAQHATYRTERIASRQAKSADGSIPYLVAARGACDPYRKDTAA